MGVLGVESMGWAEESHLFLLGDVDLVFGQ
jgi:hypothetical protein